MIEEFVPVPTPSPMFHRYLVMVPVLFDASKVIGCLASSVWLLGMVITATGGGPCTVTVMVVLLMPFES